MGDTNEKVFPTDLAACMYEAYEEFLSIPDFSGHKTIDAMNYMADKLVKKGYMIPTTDYCMTQTYHIISGRLANFVRDYIRKGMRTPADLNFEDRKHFEDLVAAFNLLSTMIHSEVE